MGACQARIASNEWCRSNAMATNRALGLCQSIQLPTDRARFLAQQFQRLGAFLRNRGDVCCHPRRDFFLIRRSIQFDVGIADDAPPHPRVVANAFLPFAGAIGCNFKSRSPQPAAGGHPVRLKTAITARSISVRTVSDIAFWRRQSKPGIGIKAIAPTKFLQKRAA